jgi:hypothetical protein
MPSRPPLIRMQARTECKPWQRSGPDLRKRGRAGQRDRAEVLREEPLCRACTAAGREGRAGRRRQAPRPGCPVVGGARQTLRAHSADTGPKAFFRACGLNF